MEEIKKIGSYDLLEQIGEGGMATIYRARHDVLKRDVALKKMKKPVKESISRFKHEAQVSAKFNHENIVSVYDFMREGRNYYLVMEYIDGIDLRNILEIESPLPCIQAARVVHEIAQGLEYAHYKKIIHRDIKPSNVLLSKEGDIKIIDFGVAKSEVPSQLTSTGIIIGTPSYMSPEYANGQGLTTQSDIYSLGVVLFELLTGFKPFVAAGNSELIVAISKGKYKKPRKYNKNIPLRLQRIVARAMHVNTRKRYKTMSEFIRVLERFLKNEAQSDIKEELKNYFKEVDKKIHQKKYDSPIQRSRSSENLQSPFQKWRKTLVFIFSFLIFVSGGYFGFLYLQNSYFAKLQLRVNIKKAVTVYIDGELAGRTENGLFYKTFIPPGKKNIVIDAGPNYQRYERRGIFHQGQTKVTPVVIAPRNVKASFTIDSIPQGLKISIDGKYKGITPLNNQRIIPGIHNIEIEASGYRKYVERREFSASEDIKMLVELEKK